MSEQPGPRVGFTTDVLEAERVEEDLRALEDGDHERFSHYVPKDKLMDAMVNGTPVIALCGKVWVPSRDPEKSGAFYRDVFDWTLRTNDVGGLSAGRLGPVTRRSAPPVFSPR